MLSIYFIIGAFSGLLSGLFGIGGGVIVVPALAAMFLYHTLIPEAYAMPVAIGTSLASMMVTSTAAMMAHQKTKSVRWNWVKSMLPGLMIGVVIGAVIARYLPSRYLSLFFGVFLMMISIRLFFEKSEVNNPSKKILSRRTEILSSSLIGILSSLLGVGGGTLLVPFFLRCQLEMHEATGTSVACAIAISIMATLCFMFLGGVGHLPMKWSTGYIYWPAFLGIAIASVLFAPLGVQLGRVLSTALLKRFFALFLLAIAADMLIFNYF